MGNNGNGLHLPPHSVECEQALLVSMLIEPYNIPEIVSLISPSDFFKASHQKIFSAITGLSKDNVPVDMVTIHDRLVKTGALNSAGGVGYLSELMNTVPVAVNAPHYAESIRNKAILRKAISVLSETIQKCMAGEDDAIHKAISELKNCMTGNDKTTRHISDCVVDAAERFDARCKSKGLSGIETGLTKLDVALSGLQRSDLVVLAARPSMGKTSLACNFVLNAARKGIHSVFYSLEMSEQSLIDFRFIPIITTLSTYRIESVHHTVDERELIHSAYEHLHDLPIWIDDKSVRSVLDLCRKARKHAATNKTDLIVIDYLSYLKMDSKKQRNDEIGDITKELKTLAKDLNVPVILLAQLNRKCEERNDKRPILSDLRDSGEIEQDADVVMFLYRDDRYKNEEISDPVPAEIIIAKNRNRATGRFIFDMHRPSTRFLNQKGA